MSRAQRALASAAEAAASGGGCSGKSHAEAFAEGAALERWADELEELAELAAEDADGSDQDEPKSARTSTASCELPLSSRYARVIGDVQDAVYRADDRQRGDIPRLAAHRGHSFKMLSDRATATAAAAAAAAASAAVCCCLCCGCCHSCCGRTTRRGHPRAHGRYRRGRGGGGCV